jgi:hypothetical protein
MESVAAASAALAQSRPALGRPRLGGAASVQQALQQPTESLSPFQTRGMMQGRNARVPVVVAIVGHFYYSSQTSGFSVITYAGTISATNDDISPQA